MHPRGKRERNQLTSKVQTSFDVVWRPPDHLPMLKTNTKSPNHWSEECIRMQQRVEQSLEDLDELLVRIKERQLVRRESMGKGGERQKVRIRGRNAGRRVPRLDLSAVVG